MSSASTTSTKVHCFHCGDPCQEQIPFDNHVFCCTGCRNVYELLATNNLCDYYNLGQTPGLSRRNPVGASRFNYLDEPAVQSRLIDYKDDKITRTTFFIPVMHCASCIWLLEHLYRIETGVMQSRVNFLKKTVTITFATNELTLRRLVELLTSLGYEPAINLNDIETQVKKSVNRRLSYQIGVAGFCFGNIMLISFPEYFGLDSFTRESFSRLFGYLNFGLSLPVFLFSAQDYFRNAYEGLRKRFVGIDVPLALGILILFLRSSWEVFSHTGIGYFDTHAGLVFFLLIGKWFQQKTFDTLSFERDYKSYFPVAVSVLKEAEETTVPVNALNIGDRLLIRNQELIPADAILLKGEAHIDFSFVTGESAPVDKVLGEIIYAGGRQVGQSIEVEVSKKVSQSYLTQLWNSDLFAKESDSRMDSFQSIVSKYFTYVLLIVAFGAAAFWLFANPSLSMNAFTSVLIIACPCALALSSPFALGTAMRILGNNKCYLKSAGVVEQMAHTNMLVFDKTGTITLPTTGASDRVNWHGELLQPQELGMIYSVAAQSMHPMSRKIVQHLAGHERMEVRHFEELNGQGSKGVVSGRVVMLGAEHFVGAIGEPHRELTLREATGARVYVSIGGTSRGFFLFPQIYREGLSEVAASLRKTHQLSLLSGDNDSERVQLQKILGDDIPMHFRQSPMDKLNRIEQLKGAGNKVMMVGDGLNDAGALKSANVGISITEDIAHFSPASDVIMDASGFTRMPDFIRFSKGTLRVIHMSFVISLIYNIIGLSFAVQGTLSPLIAAILMPLSSVTVIAFTTLTTTIYAKLNQLK